MARTDNALFISPYTMQPSTTQSVSASARLCFAMRQPSLPVELLEQIFSFAESDLASLRALVLCTRTFRILASRLLYRTVSPFNMLHDTEYAAFCDALRTNPLFAAHTRRLDLNDVRVWPNEACHLRNLEQLALGPLTEIPVDCTINDPTLGTFPKLRALACSGTIPAGFIQRHTKLDTLNVGDRELDWETFASYGPGAPMRYLEIPFPVATTALVRDAQGVRWPRDNDGVLAVTFGKSHDGVGAFLDALDASPRAPETLALHCSVAAQIYSLLPDAHIVRNPRIQRLCLQVSYTKAPMTKLLPAILAHFPCISALELTHDPERPLYLLAPLRDVWESIKHSFYNVRHFELGGDNINGTMERRKCMHGRLRCQPNCAHFETRMGFAVSSRVF
ncbi:hypothetical protein EXIGLDRAFT_759398 [Exidia glandulosa HHB12029]|uniref:Uncharacterized protein n=1 Tax=Exidia glandulosa HHB12029 TaxID=1314781 RepID=A0A165Q517_EXIGL|nr:hypothetical protein EXIGLDRAFT_759398 [Exidia glandulosa HHB12029]